VKCDHGDSITSCDSREPREGVRRPPLSIVHAPIQRRQRLRRLKRTGMRHLQPVCVLLGALAPHRLPTTTIIIIIIATIGSPWVNAMAGQHLITAPTELRINQADTPPKTLRTSTSAAPRRQLASTASSLHATCRALASRADQQEPGCPSSCGLGCPQASILKPP
jgi:hypothetical protein